jgi:hypothetical protein
VSIHQFSIGGHRVCIVFKTSATNGIHLLPSFAPFATDTSKEGRLLFTLTVDDDTRPIKDRKLVRKFDTGNGDTVVYQLPDGGYQFIIRDIHNRDCCLLVCNADFSECKCALNGDWSMRSFGLNDAIMLIFAFAGAHFSTLLIHASCVSYQGKAYPFTAQSGTGKSTHTSLWMKHIEGTELMNDDNPIIRIIDGKPIVYGSPWSGKTPCYRNIKAPLGAITQIKRAPYNKAVRLSVVEAFACLLPACSSMKWDETLYDLLCDAISTIIQTTPIYTMNCLPDEEAAHVCQQTIAP